MLMETTQRIEILKWGGEDTALITSNNSEERHTRKNITLRGERSKT